MKKALLAACLCGLFLLQLASTAWAASISYSAQVPGQMTDWLENAVLPQFDPCLGSLDRVSCTLSGQVYGMAMFENMVPMSADVSLNVWADLMLSVPEDAIAVTVTPLIHLGSIVNAYDGVVDWQGPSGRTISYSSDLYDSQVSQSIEGNLSRFVGKGSISLPITSLAYSAVTGPGNVRSSVQTYASADVTVTYSYTPLVVPEPGALLPLCLGVAGAVFSSRRSRRG